MREKANTKQINKTLYGLVLINVKLKSFSKVVSSPECFNSSKLCQKIIVLRIRYVKFQSQITRSNGANFFRPNGDSFIKASQPCSTFTSKIVWRSSLKKSLLKYRISTKFTLKFDMDRIGTGLMYLKNVFVKHIHCFKKSYVTPSDLSN